MAEGDKGVDVVSTAKDLRQLLGEAPAATSPDEESPKHVTTEHEVTIAGQRVPYTATCGTLGKLGGDLVLLTQSEVAEVRLVATGGSSTMAIFEPSRLIRVS